VGVLHLSDEDYTAGTYFYPWVHYVIRNHHPARLALPHVVAVPLGYKRGFLTAVRETNATYSPSPPPAVRRRYLWNFVGQTHDKPTRRSMVRAAREAGGEGFLRLTRLWNDPNGLSTADFRRVLEQSDFTLCPRGCPLCTSRFYLHSFHCHSAQCSPGDILPSGPHVR
jgi:hypothetical protein